MTQIKIPRKARTYPANFNPLRALYAAVAVQAVRDLNNPNTGRFDQFTARRFLVREAPYIADVFEIPIIKVQARIRSLTEADRHVA